MKNLFHDLLYQPILEVLIFIYKNVSFHDLGIAIILLTIFVRFLLLPFFYHGTKDQTKIQRLQPLVKKIQQDHKDDREKQTRVLLDLYKEHRINPFSGILLLIIQLPVLIALYQVFLNGLSSAVFDNYKFLSLINLNQKNALITILAVLAQYFQGRLMMPKTGTGQAAADRASQAMLYIGPAITFLFLSSLPSALGLYWLVSSLFSLGQQIFINKALEKQKQHGTIIGENKKTA
ncbi:MAG: YidC/Oxa1 family membrane protein insertase [Patescibacteria group bacterium]